MDTMRDSASLPRTRNHNERCVCFNWHVKGQGALRSWPQHGVVGAANCRSSSAAWRPPESQSCQLIREPTVRNHSIDELVGLEDAYDTLILRVCACTI